MRFIPTNCETASLAKSSAAGRAIAAMITLLDIPAAQNIANASTALRKLHAIAAPLRPNVDVRSHRIPRNGNISAKCNFPVKSGRPWPWIRVKLTKARPLIHAPMKRICATGAAICAKSCPIQYRKKTGEMTIAGAQMAA